MTIPSTVDAFLTSHRIALVGISAIASDPTRDVFRALVKLGHVVVPIRAGIDEAEGETTYARLQDVPGTIDGVMIMMSRHRSELIVEECAALHIPQIWVVGPAAASVDVQLFCKRHGLALTTTSSALDYLPNAGYRSAMRWFTGGRSRFAVTS